MRKALFLGARFAVTMGDQTSAAKYSSVAQTINGTLPRHYNGNFIFEEDNRQQDAAVICALNDGDLNDGLFSASRCELVMIMFLCDDARGELIMWLQR